jgi:hypothetical protein
VIDWWYVYHDQAGARIGFLPSQTTRDILSLAPHDFWLFDDRLLVRMLYDVSGQFLEAVEDSSPAALDCARKARDFALTHAQDLRLILARRRAGYLV